LFCSGKKSKSGKNVICKNKKKQSKKKIMEIVIQKKVGWQLREKCNLYKNSGFQMNVSMIREK